MHTLSPAGRAKRLIRFSLFARPDGRSIKLYFYLLFCIEMERLERAKKEHEELSEKIVKLKIYLASHKDELDKEDYALLLAQDYVMDLYLDILLKRIEKHS